jgi:hypothetical protein
MQKVHLIPNEAAVIGWVTSYLIDVPDFETENPEHPVHVLTKLHSRSVLHEAANRLEANFRGPGFCWLEGPTDRVTSDILRVCVENSDYPSVVAEHGHDDVALDSLDAVRSLAYKLEELGIEVNHLPQIVRDRPTWSSAG